MLRRLITQNPNSQVAKLAGELIQEYFPDEAPVASAGKFHKWISTSGSATDAVLVGYGYSEAAKSAYVRLQPKEGEVVPVLLTKLSVESREQAKKLVQEMRASEATD